VKTKKSPLGKKKPKISDKHNLKHQLSSNFVS